MVFKKMKKLFLGNRNRPWRFRAIFNNKRNTLSNSDFLVIMWQYPNHKSKF